MTVFTLIPSSTWGQLVQAPTEPMEPPWNALQVFEPLLFPQEWNGEERVRQSPEDTPVRRRQHPGYESVGIRMGAWMFDPSLTVGSFYSSNVFATNTDPRSDLAVIVHSMLHGRSLWDRHQLGLQADLRSYRYLENTGLNQTDARIRARGRIDVRHDIAILTEFQGGWLHEAIGSLTSPAAAVEPTPYRLFSGDVTYRQEFNRITASVGARVASYAYGSTRAMDGSVIDQSGRDGTIYAVHGRTDYAVSPKLGVFAAAEGNVRDLRGTPTEPLSSSGYRMLAGITAELTPLINSEVGVGYASQWFDAPTIGTIEGPAYRALLAWSPTRMINVWLKGEQIVTEAIETGATGIRAEALAVGLDYEFRRNVVMSVSGAIENDKFFGEPRIDDVYALSAEVRYLLNRHVSLSLRHRYIDRNSNIPSFTYDKQEVGINATARF